MRKTILTFVLLLFFAFFPPGAAAQTVQRVGLVAKNYSTGKEIFFPVNTKLIYRHFLDNGNSSGMLNVLLDTSVVIGIDTVALKDIILLRKKNRMHSAARVAAIPVMVLGVLFMGEGVAALYYDGKSGDGWRSFGLGAGMFAIGLLPYSIGLGEVYTGKGSDWQVEIIK